MTKFIETIRSHEWEIVHFKHNNTLYMDGAYVGDFKNDEYVSNYIREIAKHINRQDIEDLPFN